MTRHRLFRCLRRLPLLGATLLLLSLATSCHVGFHGFHHGHHHGHHRGHHHRSHGHVTVVHHHRGSGHRGSRRGHR